MSRETIDEHYVSDFKVFHKLRQRVNNHPPLDQTEMDRIDQRIKLALNQSTNKTNGARRSGDISLLSTILLLPQVKQNVGYKYYALRQCATHGWLEGVQYLHEHGVEIFEVPIFAAMKGHLHIIQWISSITNYLQSSTLTMSMEVVSYAIEVGNYPEVPIWMLKQEFVSPTYCIQAAVRRGRIETLEPIYQHLKASVSQDELNRALMAGFPYVWTHTIATPERMCDLMEFFAFVSDTELEDRIRKKYFAKTQITALRAMQTFQAFAKRNANVGRAVERLNETSGRLGRMSRIEELNHTVISELNRASAERDILSDPSEKGNPIEMAFYRGLKRKFSVWASGTPEQRHRMLEVLMQSQSDVRLDHIADLVDGFLFQVPTLSPSAPVNGYGLGLLSCTVGVSG